MVAALSRPVSMRSSVSAPTMPSRPAYRFAMRFLCLRQVSMTPAAVALMTAVTPPDCAYRAFRGPGFGVLRTFMGGEA